jgi:hypothetical protein
MLTLALFLLGLALVPLTGGTWRRLATLRLRHGWLAVASLACQIVVLEVPGLPEGPSATVHVLTYLLAGVFVIVNRRLSGLWLLALGAASNGVTIALNGGTLPASPQAMRTAGIEVEEGFVNSGVLVDPVLPWLGDVFAVPASVPLANVFSVGDVLIVIGAWWMLWAASRPVPSPSADWWLSPGTVAECPPETRLPTSPG